MLGCWDAGKTPKRGHTSMLECGFIMRPVVVAVGRCHFVVNVLVRVIGQRHNINNRFDS